MLIRREELKARQDEGSRVEHNWRPFPLWQTVYEHERQNNVNTNAKFFVRSHAEAGIRHILDELIDEAVARSGDYTIAESLEAGGDGGTFLQSISMKLYLSCSTRIRVLHTHTY